MSDINWSQELRKIEREYETGLPPLHTRTQIRMQRIQEVVSKARFEQRLGIIGIWTRLVLVGALGTALYWWPYGNACGFPLMTFLASYVMVIIGGLAVGGPCVARPSRVALRRLGAVHRRSLDGGCPPYPAAPWLSDAWPMPAPGWGWVTVPGRDDPRAMVRAE